MKKAILVVAAISCLLPIFAKPKKGKGPGVVVQYNSTKPMAGDPVEKHDTAILVVDMQNDFVKPGAVLCVDRALQTVPAIEKLNTWGRQNGAKVIFVVRSHRASGVDVDAPRVKLFVDGKPGYCVPNTKGHDIVDGLTVTNEDIIFEKVRNSAFFQTNLDLVLRRMGVKTVIVCGTQYPNCVRGTAVDAMCYDYDTVVCTDASSGKTEEVEQANIFDMNNMGIRCMSLDDIVAGKAN